MVDNDKDKDYDYVIVNPFDVVKVNSLTAKKAYFEAAEDNTRTYNPDIDDVAFYSGMAEDDYAYLTKNTYTVSGDWEAVKADTVSGKVAGIKGSDPNQSIQVSGSWYKQAAPATKVTVPNNGDDLEYAVVANGYFFATEGSTGSADRLALVLKVGNGDFDSDYRNVKMLLSDGTTTTTKAYVKNGSDKDDPDVGVLYTYTSNSDGYVLKAITNGTNIGMDSDIIDDAGTKYSSTTNKIGAKRVAADAKVFVLSEKSDDGKTYTGKLVTGATADKWADDDYSVTVAFTDGNVKIMVVDMAAAKIPNATDDSLYGVILSDPYTSTNDDGDTFYNMDLLTKDGVKEGVQVEDSEVTDTIAKNQFVSYKMDGDKYVDFNEASGGATAVVGAVTDVDGKYITVQPTTGSAIELKIDEDDSTILYVDTTAGDAATGEIKKANKKDNDNYYANIMVIYKKAAETDGTNVIWGAAFDVSNTLQNADDEDVLVAIPKS